MKKIPYRWEEKNTTFNVLLHSVNMIHGVEGEISHYLVISQMQKQNRKMMKPEHLHHFDYNTDSYWLEIFKGKTVVISRICAWMRRLENRRSRSFSPRPSLRLSTGRSQRRISGPQQTLNMRLWLIWRFSKIFARNCDTIHSS